MKCNSNVNNYLFQTHLQVKKLRDALAKRTATVESERKVHEDDRDSLKKELKEVGILVVTNC